MSDEVKFPPGWLIKDCELAKRRAEELGLVETKGAKGMSDARDVIEKMARAIANANEHWDWDKIPDTDADLVPGGTTYTKADYTIAARAALSALADNVNDVLVAAALKEFENVIVFTRQESMRCAIAAAMRAASQPTGEA